MFSPDVTNFERVFARFFTGRRVEGQGAIVINRFCGGALRCKIGVPVVVAAEFCLKGWKSGNEKR